uniref:Putative secreted protein n=1 Tax=Anopheles darlingi TaxID=43151 RepID=A0A2M4DEZ9_ANODA
MTKNGGHRWWWWWWCTKRCASAASVCGLTSARQPPPATTSITFPSFRFVRFASKAEVRRLEVEFFFPFFRNHHRQCCPNPMLH